MRHRARRQTVEHRRRLTDLVHCARKVQLVQEQVGHGNAGLTPPSAGGKCLQKLGPKRHRLLGLLKAKQAFPHVVRRGLGQYVLSVVLCTCE